MVSSEQKPEEMDNTFDSRWLFFRYRVAQSEEQRSALLETCRKHPFSSIAEQKIVLGECRQLIEEGYQSVDLWRYIITLADELNAYQLARQGRYYLCLNDDTLEESQRRQLWRSHMLSMFRKSHWRWAYTTWCDLEAEYGFSGVFNTLGADNVALLFSSCGLVHVLLRGIEQEISNGAPSTFVDVEMVTGLETEHAVRWLCALTPQIAFGTQIHTVVHRWLRSIVCDELSDDVQTQVRTLLERFEEWEDAPQKIYHEATTARDREDAAILYLGYTLKQHQREDADAIEIESLWKRIFRLVPLMPAALDVLLEKQIAPPDSIQRLLGHQLRRQQSTIQSTYVYRRLYESGPHNPLKLSLPTFDEIIEGHLFHLIEAPRLIGHALEQVDQEKASVERLNRAFSVMKKCAHWLDIRQPIRQIWTMLYRHGDIVRAADVASWLGKTFSDIEAVVSASQWYVEQHLISDTYGLIYRQIALSSPTTVMQSAQLGTYLSCSEHFSEHGQARQALVVATWCFQLWPSAKTEAAFIRFAEHQLSDTQILDIYRSIDIELTDNEKYMGSFATQHAEVSFRAGHYLQAFKQLSDLQQLELPREGLEEAWLAAFTGIQTDREQRLSALTLLPDIKSPAVMNQVLSICLKHATSVEENTKIQEAIERFFHVLDESTFTSWLAYVHKHERHSQVRELCTTLNQQKVIWQEPVLVRRLIQMLDVVVTDDAWSRSQLSAVLELFEGMPYPDRLIINISKWLERMKDKARLVGVVSSHWRSQGDFERASDVLRHNFDSHIPLQKQHGFALEYMAIPELAYATSLSMFLWRARLLSDKESETAEAFFEESIAATLTPVERQVLYTSLIEYVETEVDDEEHEDVLREVAESLMRSSSLIGGQPICPAPTFGTEEGHIDWPTTFDNYCRALGDISYHRGRVIDGIISMLKTRHLLFGDVSDTLAQTLEKTTDLTRQQFENLFSTSDDWYNLIFDNDALNAVGQRLLSICSAHFYMHILDVGGEQARQTKSYKPYMAILVYPDLADEVRAQCWPQVLKRLDRDIADIPNDLYATATQSIYDALDDEQQFSLLADQLEGLLDILYGLADEACVDRLSKIRESEARLAEVYAEDLMQPERLYQLLHRRCTTFPNDSDAFEQIQGLAKILNRRADMVQLAEHMIDRLKEKTPSQWFSIFQDDIFCSDEKRISYLQKYAQYVQHDDAWFSVLETGLSSGDWESASEALQYLDEDYLKRRAASFARYEDTLLRESTVTQFNVFMPLLRLFLNINPNAHRVRERIIAFHREHGDYHAAHQQLHVLFEFTQRPEHYQQLLTMVYEHGHDDTLMTLLQSTVTRELSAEEESLVWISYLRLFENPDYSEHAGSWLEAFYKEHEKWIELADLHEQLADSKTNTSEQLHHLDQIVSTNWHQLDQPHAAYDFALKALKISYSEAREETCFELAEQLEDLEPVAQLVSQHLISLNDPHDVSTIARRAAFYVASVDDESDWVRHFSEIVVKHDPHDEAAYNLLEQHAAQTNSFDEASVLLDLRIEAAGETADQIKLSQALVSKYENAGAWEQAESTHRKLLKLAPNDYGVFQHFDQFLKEREKIDQREIHLKKMAAQFTNHDQYGRVLGTLIELYIRDLGEPGDALPWIEQAHEHGEASSRILEWLSVVDEHDTDGHSTASVASLKHRVLRDAQLFEQAALHAERVATQQETQEAQVFWLDQAREDWLEGAHVEQAFMNMIKRIDIDANLADGIQSFLQLATDSDNLDMVADVLLSTAEDIDDVKLKSEMLYAAASYIEEPIEAIPAYTEAAALNDAYMVDAVEFVLAHEHEGADYQQHISSLVNHINATTHRSLYLKLLERQTRIAQKSGDAESVIQNLYEQVKINPDDSRLKWRLLDELIQHRSSEESIKFARTFLDELSSVEDDDCPRLAKMLSGLLASHKPDARSWHAHYVHAKSLGWTDARWLEDGEQALSKLSSKIDRLDRHMLRVYLIQAYHAEQNFNQELKLLTAHADELRRTHDSALSGVLLFKAQRAIRYIGEPETGFQSLGELLKRHPDREDIRVTHDHYAEQFADWDSWLNVQRDIFEDSQGVDPLIAKRYAIRAAEGYQKHLGNYDAAAAMYENALRLKVGTSEEQQHILEALRLIFVEQDEAEGQLEIYEKLLALTRAEAEEDVTDTHRQYLSSAITLAHDRLNDAFSTIRIAENHYQTLSEMPALLRVVADAYRSQKKFTAAVGYFKTFIAAPSIEEEERIEARLSLAEILSKDLRQADDARDEWKAVLEADPFNETALENVRERFEQSGREDDGRLLVEVYGRRHDPTGVCTLYRQMGHHAFERQDRPRAHKMYLRAADCAEHELHDGEIALMCMLQCMRVRPNDPDTRSRVRSLARQHEMNDVVVDFLEELIDDVEHEGRKVLAAELKEMLGDIHLNELGETAESMRIFEAVLQAQPGRPYAFDCLVRIYIEREEYAAYRELRLKRSRSTQDDNIRADDLAEAARVECEFLERASEGIRNARAALKLVPEHPVARDVLLNHMDESDDAPFMRRLLERALADQLKEAPNAQETLALRKRLAVFLVEELGDYSAAQDHWERLYEETGLQAIAFVTLSEIYHETGQHTKFEALISEQIELSTDVETRASHLLTRGRLRLLKLKDRPAAIEDLTQALRIAPGLDEARSRLIDAYRENEDWELLAETIRSAIRRTSKKEDSARLRFDLADVLIDPLQRIDEAHDVVMGILELGHLSMGELDRCQKIFEISQFDEGLFGVYDQKAAQTTGSEAASYLLEMARIRRKDKAGRQDAIDAYRKVLQLIPEEQSAGHELSEVYAEQANWQSWVKLQEERLDVTRTPAERKTILVHLMQVYEKDLIQPDMAFLAACRAYKEDESDESIREKVEALGFKTDNAEIVISVYEDVLDGVPDVSRTAFFYERMGDIAVQHLDEADEAERYYRQVLEINSRSLIALQGLKSIYGHQKKWGPYVQVGRRLAKLADTKTKRYDGLVSIAEHIYESEGAVPLVLDVYREVLTISPNEAETLRRMSELCAAGDLWVDWLEIMQRRIAAAKTKSEQRALRRAVADIYETEMNDLERALEMHHLNHEHEPNDLPTLRSMTHILTELDRQREVIDYYEKINLTSRDLNERIEVLSKVAAIWDTGLNNQNEALRSLEKILEIDPGHIGTLAYAERLAKGLGDQNRQIRLQRQYASHVDAPETRLRLLSELGASLHGHGETEAAERAYYDALELDAQYQPALIGLADFYQQQQRYKERVKVQKDLVQVTQDVDLKLNTLTEMGDTLLQHIGDLDAADAIYQRVLRLEPKNLHALSQLQEISDSNGHQRNALTWLQQRARATIDEQERAILFSEAGDRFIAAFADPRAATEEYEQALLAVNHHVPAGLALMDIYYKSENWKALEALLLWLVEEKEAAQGPKERAAIHFRLAYAAERLGHEEIAYTHFGQAHKLDQKSLNAAEGYIRGLVKREQSLAAVKAYQTILVHHHDNLSRAEIVEIHHHVAELYLKVGDRERCEKSLLRGLELDPHHQPCLTLLAHTQQLSQNYEAAYESMNRLIQLQSGVEKVDTLRALSTLSEEHLNDIYRAIDALEEANRQQPGDITILRQLCKYYQKTKQSSRAVDILSELIRLTKNKADKVRLHHSLGETYRDELRQTEVAIQCFNAALDIDAKHLKSFQAIEQVLTHEKDWRLLEKNYIKMLQRPIEDTQAKLVIWQTLGDLYRFKIKDFKKAVQAYEVVQRAHPEDLDLVVRLAELQRKDPTSLDKARANYIVLLNRSVEHERAAVHALFSIAIEQRDLDYAYVIAGAALALGDMNEKEEQFYRAYKRKKKKQSPKSLTMELWMSHVIVDEVNRDLATIASALSRFGAELLFKPTKNITRNRKIEEIDVDAPVVSFFAKQVRYVREMMGLHRVRFFVQKSANAPLEPVPVVDPTLVVGVEHELLQETNEPLIWFNIARQLGGLMPPFIVPRLLGRTQFQALVEQVILSIDPTYGYVSDAQTLAKYKKLVARLMENPQFVDQVQPAIQGLLTRGERVSYRGYMEGLEYSILRAAFLITNDIEITTRAMRAPAPSTRYAPAWGDRLRSLVRYCASDRYMEVRHALRLGQRIKKG